MKIQNVVTIDGNIVDKVFQKGGVVVYQYKSYMDKTILYFTENDVVLFKQTIEADCDHNQGFTSNINFKGVK